MCMENYPACNLTIPVLLARRGLLVRNGKCQCGRRVCVHPKGEGISECVAAQKVVTKEGLYYDGFQRRLISDENLTTPPSLSRSKGESLLFNLGRWYQKDKSVPGSTSFLSQGECAGAIVSVSDGRPVRHLVAYLTPFLTQHLLPVFGDHCVLVNSESCAWIPHCSANNKFVAPAQFIAPHYLVNFRVPHLNVPFAGENAQYGSFGDFSARSGICAILDAKIEVDSVAIGEFEDVMKSISVRSDSDGMLEKKGMLYDPQNVFLFTAFNGHVNNITHCRWAADGSMDIIREFFRAATIDNWHLALEYFTAATGMELPKYSSTQLAEAGQCGACALLGQGATGRVLQLVGDCCVKIVHGMESVVELRNEYDNVTNVHANACIRDALPIIGCRLGSFQTHFLSNGQLPVAWFLMDDVGKPFKNAEEINAGDILGMCQSLSVLHSCGIVHGDARYHNVLKVGDSYRWIDLRTLEVCTKAGIKNDICLLLKTLRRPLPDADLLDTYAGRACVNTWRARDRENAVKELMRYI